MDERFAVALADAFPTREIPETPVQDPSIAQALSLGERNGTVCVEFDDGTRVYCKIAVDGEGSRLATERAALEYVDTRCAVPVPTVLASDPDAAVPYLVTAPIDCASRAVDESDSDTLRDASLLRAVGRTLARIHTCRFDAHGEITGGGADGLDVDTGSWTAVFVNQVRDIPTFAHSALFEEYVDDVVAAIETNREVLDAAPAALVHGDPNEENCKCVSRTGVGLLDWEHAHVGDPARDLHRVLEQRFGFIRPADPDHLVAALYDGYRDQAGGLPDGIADRLPIYEVVRLLAAAALVDLYAASADESRADAVDWVRTELDRRLDAIR